MWHVEIHLADIGLGFLCPDLHLSKTADKQQTFKELEEVHTEFKSRELVFSLQSSAVVLPLARSFLTFTSCWSFVHKARALKVGQSTCKTPTFYEFKT